MGFGGKGLSLKAMAKIAEYSCHPILFYEYMEKRLKSISITVTITISLVA